jgi:3-hydroxyacyl-CoA dehydrogenase
MIAARGKPEIFAEFRKANARKFRGFLAPEYNIRCVEAAVNLPFDEGMKVERQLFMELMSGTQSAAQRYVFFAERQVWKIPDVPEDTPLVPVRKVGMIGAGTMGGGIAMNFANVGIPVTLVETKQDALDRGLAVIRRNYETTAKRGRLSMADVDKRMSLLTGSLSLDALADCDLIIEAVFENMALKKEVFAKLDTIAKPGAVLATNTSALDVNEIATAVSRPEAVVGMHFFSPANVMRLLEVVRGAATAKDVLATTLALAKKIRKLGVVSGVCDGFIGNRMIEQYSRQAAYMLEEGATPQQVDRAIERFGFAMGPFRMADLAGNDVGWYIRKRRYLERPDMLYPKIPDKVCELGRFGQKTGAGYYRYEAGKRDAIPDPVIDKLIADHRAELGITPRRISDEEIVQRLIFALVNEGAKILEEGIALRASDIDMIYLTGYGFPAHVGGPMLYADVCGLYTVVNRMRGFAALGHGDTDFWTPAPLLARLAAEGKGFNG